MEDMGLIKILWDYMHMNQPLQPADCIIGLGCSDTKVAYEASKVFLAGYADKLFFTGGLGKVTYRLWNEPEADKFARIAVESGVPMNAIRLERESTNTGDNFNFTRRMMEEEGLDIHTCLVVCKPYSERRTYAAFQKMMPGYDCIIHSEPTTCEEYAKRMGTKDWMSVLVGDVQRMKIFAENGWQVPMEVPQEVWSAYEELVKRGYDQFVLEEKSDYLASRRVIEQSIRERGWEKE